MMFPHTQLYMFAITLLYAEKHVSICKQLLVVGAGSESVLVVHLSPETLLAMNHPDGP